MNGLDDDDRRATYASPPCYMHELDPTYVGADASSDRPRRGAIMRWRRARRKSLIDQRLAMGGHLRRSYSKRIAATLEEIVPSVDGLTFAVYWPFKGEPDLRRFMERVYMSGGRCALPVVARCAEPLKFRSWVPGAPLGRDVSGMPIPEEGPELIPDVVISPVVGFDPSAFRLGYGGGYYDRTLAGMSPRPRVIGVGYGQASITTIHPLPHDIPMDLIVTEEGVAPAMNCACKGR